VQVSDFTKEICAVCGSKEAFRVANGICQKCFLADKGSHGPSASGILEEAGDKIDAKFEAMWKVIRAQGDRIAALEQQVKGQPQ
jgi:ribosomal protein L37AE/L43A